MRNRHPLADQWSGLNRGPKRCREQAAKSREMAGVIGEKSREGDLFPSGNAVQSFVLLQSMAEETRQPAGEMKFIEREKDGDPNRPLGWPVPTLGKRGEMIR